MLIRSKLTLSLAIVAVFCFNGVDLHAQATEGGTEVQQETSTIAAEIADEAGFATLNSALKSAGLVESLEGEGPFTVFAPSEEAFKKVGADTLEELLREESKDQLIALLKAHVASGEWTAEKISSVSEIPTVDGGSLAVTRQDDKLMVGAATIDHENSIKCKNGLIHCIDAVLPAK